MNATASPTVFRFFTSSSGILTSNFSSAATTTSTMESESTSRSSTNDLSCWTSSAGMPATSLTISARSARISSVVAIAGSSFTVCVRDGSADPGRSARGTGGGLGDLDDLGGVGQTGAERDQQRDVPAPGLPVVDHPTQGEG